VLRRLIGCRKPRFPQVQIVGRGDSAVAVPRRLRMREEAEREGGGIADVFGWAQHAGLLRQGAAAWAEARARFGSSGQSVQYCDTFAYGAESWPPARHVVMNAAMTEPGENPRFVVTARAEVAPALLSHAYCERGQGENFLKDFKTALQAARLSCQTVAANFFRLLDHAAAYLLLPSLRPQVAPRAPRLGRAQVDPRRLSWLKVAASVSYSTRRVRVRLPHAFPLAALFRQLAQTLAAPPVLSSA
jgi:Transposase DDE domain group 1